MRIDKKKVNFSVTIMGSGDFDDFVNLLKKQGISLESSKSLRPDTDPVIVINDDMKPEESKIQDNLDKVEKAFEDETMKKMRRPRTNWEKLKSKFIG